MERPPCLKIVEIYVFR